MKKFLGLCLSICMVLGLALSASAEVARAASTSGIEAAEAERFTVISKDMITGEVTTEEIEYYAQSDNARSTPTDGYMPPYIPPHLEVAEWPGPADPEISLAASGIIGSDDRVRVSDTEAYPYSAVCYMETTIGGVESVGTAWMVSDNIAITAGHCVYDGGTLASEVTVWPGKDGYGVWNNPYGTAEKISVVCPDWSSSGEDDRYDWAIIILDENIGNETGWFGCTQWQSDVLSRPFTISGYPASHQYYQYTATGYIAYADANYLSFSIDATAGQSGSPIYNSDYTVYGIFTRNSGLSANIGVRITEAIYNYISGYCNSY